VIEHLAGAKYREAAARNAAEHLEEPHVAGSINPYWPRDHYVESFALPELARDHFRPELRSLIHVTRTKWGVLIRWGRLDVAVYTAGAAMDYAPRAPSFRGLENVTSTVDVNRRIGAVGLSRLSVRRRDVIDDIHA
jgi:hypothetical protein